MSAASKNGADAYPKEVPKEVVWLEGEHYDHLIKAGKLNAPVEKSDKCGIKMTPTPRGLEMELSGKRKLFVICVNGAPERVYMWCESVGKVTG